MTRKRNNIKALLIFPFITMLGCGDELYPGPLDFFGVDIPYDDQNADIHVGMAAVAFVSDHNPEISRNNMLDIICDIADEKPDVKVIVFPETALSYYWELNDKNGGKTKERNELIAEPIPGSSTDIIAETADDLDIYVAFGMVEKAGGKIYNSLVMINPEGGIEAVHRKTNLLDSDILAGFSRGDGVTFVNIDGIKTALLICHDADSADIAEQIVNGNADVVISALADESGESFFNKDRVYTHLWNTWTVNGNKAGTEGNYWMDSNALDYAGLVGIVKPTGEIAAKNQFKDGGYVYYNVGVYK